MSDRDWRELERRFNAGEHELLPRLNAALQRAGMPIRRINVVHYVRVEDQHRLLPDGAFDHDARWAHSAFAQCGGTMLHPRPRGYRQVHWTSEIYEVTCKSCLRSLNSPNYKPGKPLLHLLIRHADGREHHLCRGRGGASTENIEEVGCYACIGLKEGKHRTKGGHPLNARGRRRLRRRRMFAT